MMSKMLKDANLNKAGFDCGNASWSWDIGETLSRHLCKNKIKTFFQKVNKFYFYKTTYQKF